MNKSQLLMIPGLAATSRMWEDVSDELSDVVDCKIAALPGLDDLGAIADAILGDIDGPFALAGWSMGGYLAFELLRRAPDRVERLALMSTTAHPESREVRLRRRIMVRDAKKGYLDLIRQATPRFLHPDHAGDEIIGRIMVEQADDVGLDAFCRHQSAIMNRPDYRPLAAALDMPVVVMVGDGDIVTPISDHAEMARSIPGAELVVVPGAGHMVTLENPHETACALRHWMMDQEIAIAA